MAIKKTNSTPTALVVPSSTTGTNELRSIKPPVDIPLGPWPWIVGALVLGLLGWLIWIAENIATYFNAWQYPSQRGEWHMVDTSKLSSWCLLIIVSFIVVAALKDPIARWKATPRES